MWYSLGSRKLNTCGTVNIMDSRMDIGFDMGITVPDRLQSVYSIHVAGLTRNFTVAHMAYLDFVGFDP